MAVNGAVVVMLLYWGGNTLLSLRASWRVHAQYADLMWVVALMGSLQVAIGMVVVHENACKRFRYLIPYGIPIALEVVFLCGAVFLGGALESCGPKYSWLQGGLSLGRLVWIMTGARAVGLLLLLGSRRMNFFRVSDSPVRQPSRKEAS